MPNILLGYIEHGYPHHFGTSLNPQNKTHYFNRDRVRFKHWFCSLKEDALNLKTGPNMSSVPGAVVCVLQRNLPAALDQDEDQKESSRGVDASHGYNLHTHKGLTTGS